MSYRALNPAEFPLALMPGVFTGAAELQMDGLDHFEISTTKTIGGTTMTVGWRECGHDITRVVRSDKPVTIIVPASRPIKLVFNGHNVSLGQA
jgi:hypothetical protein